MKLTQFEITVAGAVSLAIVHILLFIFEDMFQYSTAAHGYVIIITVLFLSITSMDMKNLYGFRYRVYRVKSYWYVAEYLTLGLFFIPVWKPVFIASDMHKYPNIHYNIEGEGKQLKVVYRSDIEAEKAINLRKKKIFCDYGDYFVMPWKSLQQS